MMRPSAFAVLCAAATALSAHGQTPTPSTPTFAQVVNERFDAWDTDRSGTLSPEEIDALCVNGAIKGAEAAAAAALKRIVRSERYELPALDRAYLTSAPRNPGPSRPDPRPEDGDASDADVERTQRPGDAEKPAGAAPARVPSWQAAFRQSLSRIQHSSRDLYGDMNAPSLAYIHQGPLGDCYFVAPIGAAVNRNPKQVASMIAARPAEEGGGYRVTLPTGRTLDVSSLTDAEIGLSSTTSGRTGDNGLWLAVLEKALGTMRMEDRPEKYSMDAATDAIARGGSARETIRLLTGHATDTIALRRKAPEPDGRAASPPTARKPRRAGDPPGPSLVPAGDVGELAGTLRTRAVAALAAGRLVTMGTGDEKLPPGISSRHAYAVLSYSAEKDTFTIWNPHGNTFPGRGRTLTEPGIANGYPTKGGVFEVPVADVPLTFRGVVIETDRKPEPQATTQQRKSPGSEPGAQDAK